MTTGAVVLKPPLLRRLAAVLALLLLSPISAEYLIGYDEIIGNPLDMLTGLLILGPLYGSVAVLIREIVRRTGRGWPTIVLLGAAFGLIQAGVIDQSLFNPDFTDEASWDRDRLPTLVGGTGVSAYYLLSFLAGHVVWSFAAPIAVVESCAPRLAGRAWLGRSGIAGMVMLYLLAAVVIFKEHTKDFMASPVQLGATVALALVLAALAFAIPRRGASGTGRAPAAWLVGCGAVLLLTTHHFLPASWAGAALDVLVLSLVGGLLLWASGRAGWGKLHVLAAAGGALVVNTGLSFVVEPLGTVSHVVKYGANAGLLVVVLTLLGWAWRRLARDGVGDGLGEGEGTGRGVRELAGK